MKAAGNHRHALVALAAIAIAIAVFGPNLVGRQINELLLQMPGIDKVLHTVEYALLFVVLTWIGRRLHSDPRRQMVVATIGGLALAGLDEAVQSLARGRHVETLDLMADAAGLTLGYVVVARPGLRLAAAASVVAVSVTGAVSYATYKRLADYSRGLEFERHGDFARARASYLRAEASGLHTPALHNGLAWTSVESGIGDPGTAVRYARIALDAEPDNADFQDTYGWALVRAGRSADALPYLQRSYAKAPGMFCIHYHLAEAYRATGQHQLAAFHYRQQQNHGGTREARLAAAALASWEQGR